MRWTDALWWTLRVLALAVTTIFLVATVAETLRSPAPPSGSPRWGTATVTRCGAGRPAGCFGDFASADGGIRRSGVRIWYADGSAIGARVRAYADTADGDVTHPGGQGTVMNIGGFVFLSVVWLVSLIWLLGSLPLRGRS